MNFPAPENKLRRGWPWEESDDNHNSFSLKIIPKITIITPSYNQGIFLEETIRSILLQNYPKLELIVIDGGSTDNSVKLLEKYERWITYWVSENDSGQSHALNKGLKMATGDLIGWQNSDDIYKENAFWEIARLYNDKPNYDVYFGNMETIDGNSRVLRLHLYAPFSINEIKYSGWNITNQSCFFSREILNKVMIREDLRYAMDAALYLEIASKTKKFVHIKKVLGCFRLHEEAKSSNLNLTIGWKEWIDLRKEYNIEMKDNVPWKRQFVVWKCFFKIRKLIYYLPQLITGKISF